MHIAITGNIGAGKTTLTKLLSNNYNWIAQFEDTEQNPYLDDFYYDMAKWSFNLQIYFLSSRFKQIKEIRENKKNTIQDRTIYEDVYIFASNLHEMGLMQTRDYDNYLNLFNLMKEYIQAPDLLIYLRATVPTLVNQIQKRGREYETSISIDYLQRLNEKYEEWISNYTEGKLLIIDVDNMDFVDNKEDLGKIIDKVEANIHGLF
ncbi:MULTISPECIES: deoxynucleoside kinase [Apibacter]|uniref:deoxynucleoside kinase n=1 Tax=Apibacter TaxID=1778601 RepID=UPI000CFA2840|nr:MULTISPECIES: deoxynucleoside kinase [Apibacter]MCX8676396.1 deoxynucleoside kinase [Apibacter sp. B3919]MXO23860.1 AAA family ATPase [Apibacter sp. B3924]MXO26462.1 AAA family ATPase [Apibacter sp. B3813]MXO28414.1 AAA family ATPase [Apibacter sp. B3913]MXO30368.1 AAA family ATPase [Apibacter sp. B3912]